MTVNTKKAVPKELIESLLADYKKPEDLIGENGLLKQLTKLLVERALDAEMSEHLGHEHRTSKKLIRSQRSTKTTGGAGSSHAVGHHFVLSWRLRGSN